jgi:hypothetical protein
MAGFRILRSRVWDVKLGWPHQGNQECPQGVFEVKKITLGVRIFVAVARLDLLNFGEFLGHFCYAPHTREEWDRSLGSPLRNVLHLLSYSGVRYDAFLFGLSIGRARMSHAQASRLHTG